MVKRKKRIIMYMTIILMMTIGMLGIGGITFAESHETVEKLSSDISPSSESIATSQDYFEIEITSESPKEAQIKKFKKDVTPSITEVVIPAIVYDNEVGYTVTAIGDEAFKFCSSLTTIELPSSLEIIGEWAFLDCTNLTSVNLSDTLVNSIGENAFSGTALTTIEIPDTVTSIEEGVFASTGLTSVIIPNTVTSIGGYAFKGCDFTTIKLPDELESIGVQTFANCAELTTIVIPNTVISIGESAFVGCSALESITLSNKLTGIEMSTFSNCIKLTTIAIPDSVTKIGMRAFEGCSALTTITIPDSVTFIRERVFLNCSALTTITIPDTVTYIDHNAFKGCTSLEIVVLPNTLRFLVSSAFDSSAVNKLIFICQNKDDMSILDDVKTHIPSHINVYRMAVGDIKNSQEQINSYEFLSQSISLGDIFEIESVIYEGKTGDTECSDPTIKAEDYFDMSITYTLEGSMNEDTKIEDNTLYIGQDETSDGLEIEAVNGTKRKTIPIHIVRAESISIKQEPENTYDEGDEYEPDGLVITLRYTNGEETDIAYSEDNSDFTFAYTTLPFETKEQEITYKELLKVKQKLTVFGNKTLRDKNVEIKGMFTYESLLDIENAEIDNDLKDKEIIAGYDINVVNGSYKETLTIVFDVGDKYNGKKVNIRHKGNEIEEFEVIVSEGKVSVEVDNLSPFIIYTEKVVEPDIPDNITPEVPDDSKPVIKPMEPTPDKSVQTKPNQNQQNTVSTEDNNHILLWGVLGIMSMGIVIMSVKKKNRVKNK